MVNPKRPMNNSSKTLFRAGVSFLGLALLIPLISAFYGLMTPPTYSAINHLEIQPFQVDILQPGFRDSLLGRGSSIRLKPTSNTTIIQVVARTQGSRDAAELANAGAVRVQNFLRQRPGVTVEIIDRAEPPLRPIAPNLPLLVALGGGSGAVLALGAAVLLRLSRSRRRGLGEGLCAAS